jgi:hypoxanthine phosphoribosyltransferase
VRELGQTLAREYAGKTPLLVGVLKGAVVFLADLVRAASIPLALDFIGLASYGGGTSSSGVITVTTDLSGPIHDRHVIVIEDIVDSGRTLDFLRQSLARRNPRSLRVCVLLDKAGRREVQVPLDYVGFVIPNEFVVGYGLGYGELYRNLPYIAALEEEPSP